MSFTFIYPLTVYSPLEFNVYQSRVIFILLKLFFFKQPRLCSILITENIFKSTIFYNFLKIKQKFTIFVWWLGAISSNHFYILCFKVTNRQKIIYKQTPQQWTVELFFIVYILWFFFNNSTQYCLFLYPLPLQYSMCSLSHRSEVISLVLGFEHKCLAFEV